MAYDNVESPKKAGLHSLSRKCNFKKTICGVKLTPNLLWLSESNLPGFIYLGLTEFNAGSSQEVENTGQYLSFSFPVWHLVLLYGIV